MGNNINELSAAQAFVQVVQVGSFAGAAQLRNENPSSVSRAVAQLEKHLQTQLLVRSTRSVRLSEAGEIYYQYALAMLQSQADAKEALNLLGEGKPRGMVRISLPVVFGEQLLSSAMLLFRQQYPGIDLQVDLSNQPARLVEEGFDLALRVGHLADSTLRLRRLGSIHRKVYASKTYLEKHGLPQAPSDLVSHHTLMFATRGSFSGWKFWCKKTGKPHPDVEIQSWFTCSSPNVILSMIRNGLGIGRGAEWMVKSFPYSDEFVEVLPDWGCDDPALGGVPLYLVFPPGPAGQIPLKTRVVADFIQNIVPSFMLET